MPVPISPLKKLFPKGLLELAGITRIARVTELDRTGVEVACAIRPGAHILQVSQGKGLSFEHAARSAAYETIELWAAEQNREEDFIWATRNQLAQSDEVWGPVELSALTAPQLWHNDLLIPWVAANRLDRKGRVFVPAQMVYCSPPSVCDLGMLVSGWTSNGMGAHPTMANAIEHAIFELIERHTLTVTLPNGWTPQTVVGRKLDVVRESLIQKMVDADLKVAVFDLTPPRQHLPVVGALVSDERNHSIGLTAGYACRFSQEEAMRAAVLEAAQSRLTDIHGAREDIAVKGEQDDRGNAFFEMKEHKFVEKIAPLLNLAALVKASKMRLAIVDLKPNHTGVSVVKVFSPDAQVSELLA